MLTWPTALFSPSSFTPELVAASLGGPSSLSGIPQSSMISGGGLWTITFGEQVLRNKNLYNTLRAISARSDSGATPFVVPVCDRIHQPFADPTRPPGTGNGDDSVFDDGALWAGELIDANIVGSAALRATRLNIATDADADMIGGEFFTGWHTTKGQRLYQVTRVFSQGGGLADIEIRPGLREATAADFPLDFDNPRCVMTCPGGMAPLLEMLRFGKMPTIRFVESFAPVED